MSRTVEVNVHHVTRVEGHGNIRLRARDGVVEHVEWQIPEAPRFFEAMVRGRSYEDIQTIVSRICGICSVTHSLAAIKAIEQALGVTVSSQTERLRLLCHYGEQLESHSLHVGFLVAPDLLGQKSVIPLATSHPDDVKAILGIHGMGNSCMQLIGGRMTHPITFKPGGFTRFPSEAQLRDLQKKMQATLESVDRLAALVKTYAHRLPDFSRPTEYIALKDPPHYTFYHGQIGSSDTDAVHDVQDFEAVVNEYVVAQSTAKWCRWHRDAYMVGALARFNLNAQHLLPKAAELARNFGMTPPVTNPYFNSVAQVVEMAQVLEHSIQLIDELLTEGLRHDPPRVQPRAGNGAGCVEAPRGILFHRYAFDEDGMCTSANICIPTGQNGANIQKDFEAFAPAIIDRGPDEIRLLLEMLVRAYDPCISCGTHMLNVEFV